MNPANESSSGPFTKWNAEIVELFDFLEHAANRIRRIMPPPASNDVSGRVDALASLWLRCGFLPLSQDGSPPWSNKAGLLADQWRRTPEDFLRQLWGSLGEALTAGLAEVGGTDPQHRLIATADIPFFVFPIRTQREMVETPRIETLARTIRVPEDVYWAAVPLSRLADDHPLCSAIADGWRAGDGYQPCAVLGPCVNAKPAAFVAVDDVTRWTRDLRSPQAYVDMETQRKKKADDESRARFVANTERFRLDKIERELAAMKSGK